MTEIKLITFGKYAGYTYEKLMDKDINYCKFIHTCPENNKTKEFKEYLSIHLEPKLKELALKKLNKQMKVVDQIKT